MIRYICPFCLCTIIELDDFIGYNKEIEDACFKHIKKRHPIKWRFNWKFRKAMKQRQRYG